MSVKSLSVEVANITRPQITESVELLIDSQAMAAHSIVPRPILAQLGIESLGVEDFVLADGRKIKRETGRALFKFEGKAGIVYVIFGEEGDSQLLGALTHETLGLMLEEESLKSRPLLVTPHIRDARAP